MNIYSANSLHFKNIIFIIHSMLALIDILVNSCENVPLSFSYSHYFGYVGTLSVFSETIICYSLQLISH